MSAKKQSAGLTTYLASIQKHPRIDRARERELGRRIREHGDLAARDELVTANLALVISVAMKFAGRGRDVMDLISDGNVGLIEVASRFDERRGVAFVTYATPRVRGAIRSGFRDQETVHTLRSGVIEPPVDADSATVTDLDDAGKLRVEDRAFEEIEMRLTIEALLDSRERYIIVESVMHGRNMADVAKALGLSRERVRQIRGAALLKMREEII